MKKVIMFLLLAVIMASMSAVFTSCSSDDAVYDKPSYIQKPITDYCGVWVNTKDSDYFMTIYPDGVIATNIRKYHIYRGKSTLSRDTLFIDDELENKTLMIRLRHLTDSSVIINDILFYKEGRRFYSIDTKFVRSKEELVYSYKGVVYRQRGLIDEPYYKFLFYSDNLVNKQKVSRKGIILKEELHNYVPRKIGDRYYFYTQVCNVGEYPTDNVEKIWYRKDD